MWLPGLLCLTFGGLLDSAPIADVAAWLALLNLQWLVGFGCPLLILYGRLAPFAFCFNLLGLIGSAPDWQLVWLSLADWFALLDFQYNYNLAC